MILRMFRHTQRYHWRGLFHNQRSHPDHSCSIPCPEIRILESQKPDAQKLDWDQMRWYRPSCNIILLWYRWQTRYLLLTLLPSCSYNLVHSKSEGVHADFASVAYWEGSWFHESCCSKNTYPRKLIHTPELSQLQRLYCMKASSLSGSRNVLVLETCIHQCLHREESESENIDGISMRVEFIFISLSKVTGTCGAYLPYPSCNTLHH